MARDIKRIDQIVDKIRAYWKKNPDLRFGQVIYIVMEELHEIDSKIGDIFFPEDDVWNKALKSLTTKTVKSEYDAIKHKTHKSHECSKIHDGCSMCDHINKEQNELPCSICRGTVLNSEVHKQEENNTPLDCYFIKT
jgi:uncharacterized protein YihD (DUF1040 family)